MYILSSIPSTHKVVHHQSGGAVLYAKRVSPTLLVFDFRIVSNGGVTRRFDAVLHNLKFFVISELRSRSVGSIRVRVVSE